MIGTIDDIKAMEKRGVIDFTVDGKCSGCGECCSDFLPLSHEEIGRIRRYVREHGIKPHYNNVVAAGFDITCPFRDNLNGICVIYRIRPAICREFRCDYDPAKLSASKDFFHQQYGFISMRHEFFQESDGFELLREYITRGGLL